MSIEIVLVVIVVMLVLFFNWLAGFIEATFVSPRYETKESTIFLAMERLNLVKLIRSTEEFTSQSSTLVDSRSLLRKIYSKKALHIIIVNSEIDKSTKVYWVEFLKNWSITSTTKRRIIHHQESNTHLINMIVATIQ